MRASRLVLAMSFFIGAILLTDRSDAQSVYGQVAGRLVTASGTPVSGAVVSIVSTGTGAPTSVKTDNGGYFTISNLGSDLYRIEVRADGYKAIRSTIVVSADSTASVNAVLQRGDPNAFIEKPSSEISVLQLDRTDVSTLFDSRSVDDLPLFNRNLTRLQLLVPGAQPVRVSIAQNQNPQNSQTVNINGQHFSGSAFQLDGTEDRDPLEGLAVINPPLDSVREMKVTTQGYNAEFGQATAGVVTIQTRSGSNSWHGDGFGYRRTGFGQTIDPFSVAGVPPQKNAIFGGSLGGPILRNKLFIFGDYQGTRSSTGANVLLSVPTKLVRDTCLGSKPGAPTYCDFSDYSAFSGQLIDPNTGKAFLCNGVACNKVQNQAPPNTKTTHVSDQAVAMLSLLPLPNFTSPNPSCGDANVCDNFLASGAEVFNADQFDLRSDYNASASLRLFARYSFGDYRDMGSPAFGTAAGGTGTNPNGFAGVAKTRNQGIGSGFTYTLGPKTLTDFRFGYFRYRLNVDSLDAGQIPIPENSRIPGIFAPDTGDPFATGLPDIEIPGQEIRSSNGYLRFGYSPVVNACNCPLHELEQQFQFANNWTRSAGRHLIKWGADVRFLQNYRLESRIRRTGAFNFASVKTGNPNDTKDPGLGLATFLIGGVDTFSRFFSSSVVGNAGEHQRRFGFYGQDTWRLNPRLTINYGLRWEIYTPQSVTEAGGFLLPSFSNPDPATTFFNVARGGTQGGVESTYKNFAPRLGIAFQINPTTVMRAGYGRSFDAGYNGDLFGIAATQNPPVTVAQDTAAPGFNLANGPPPFIFPQGDRFSLFDLASANFNDPQNPDPTKAVPSSGATLYALPSRVRVPTVDSWNLTIQHEMASRFYLELAYVGNKGTNVFTDNTAGNTFYDLNQATLQGMILKIADPPTKPPNVCRGGVGTFSYGPGETYCLVQTLFRNFYKRAEPSPDPCQPAHQCFTNPSLFPVRYFGNNASDNYNALQAKVQKDFSHGYLFMAHYTWSKGLDFDSNYFRVDPSVGYGPANFDVRHRFVMTNIWDLPIGRGRTWFGGIGPTADRFVGGWRLSAITVWRSGLPFTPSYKNCAQDVDGNTPCRPNVIGAVHISGDREQYFSTTGGQPLPAHGGCTNSKGTDYCPVFPNGQPAPGQPIGPWQRPGAGQIGDAGRNSLQGPGLFESDVAVEKIVSLTERANLHFRVDGFNVFNRVNLGNPATCVDCSNGGLISSLAPGALQRTLQFSMQIQF